MQDWLGTRTAADINVVAQALMLLGLWVGFYFARTKRRSAHKNMQTTVVLAQLFFIFFVMVTSFYNYVVEGGTRTGAVANLMIIHGSLGFVAEGAGIYLILRMRTQVLPQRLRIRNFKLLMRATLVLWTAIALLGFGVYYYRYLVPAATIAPLAEMRWTSDELVMHALELRDAVDRDSLETARRHAEHVVNLIEGAIGSNYGDLDGDGTVEDPGDGTGMLSYLFDVGVAASNAGVTRLVESIGPELEQISARAVEAARADGLDAAKSLAPDLLSAADAAKGQIDEIDAAAKEAGLSYPVTIKDADLSILDEPNTTLVDMLEFQYRPRTVTIRKGWTVVWLNDEAPNHTATADEGLFDSGSMPYAGTFSFTFDEAGSFPYYCRFHGDKGGVDMAGTIVVE